MLFKGSGVALVTPFKKDENINFDKLEELINLHIENKTDALIICATTGEGATLDSSEYIKMIKFCVKKVSKKIPVIVGSGSNNTKITIDKSRLAQDLGADGLLVVTPYYNKCNMEGLYLHYKKINDSVNIPIIMYNVPSRTGVDMSVEIILKLSKLKNICGIKEASQDICKVAKEIKNTSKDFCVYSGNDDQILPCLSIGGSGVISVFANIYPKEMHDICDYYFKGDLLSASKLYYRYLDFMEKLFIDVNPIPVKKAMNILGYDVGNCRLPLSNLNSKKTKTLKNEILNLKVK